MERAKQQELSEPGIPTDQSSRVQPICCLLSRGAEQRLAEIDLHSNRPPWTAPLFASEFDLPHSWVFGARLNGAIVGFGVVHFVSPEAHLLNFAVDRSVRGRGIGRQLLWYIIDELRSQALETLFLEVRRSNLIAQELYRSCGFHVVAERPQYYPDDREDAFLMKLSLLGGVLA